jgi:hypothetical protein
VIVRWQQRLCRVLRVVVFETIARQRQPVKVEVRPTSSGHKARRRRVSMSRFSHLDHESRAAAHTKAVEAPTLVKMRSSIADAPRREQTGDCARIGIGATARNGRAHICQ